MLSGCNEGSFYGRMAWAEPDYHQWVLSGLQWRNGAFSSTGLDDDELFSTLYEFEAGGIMALGFSFRFFFKLVIMVVMS